MADMAVVVRCDATDIELYMVWLYRFKGLFLTSKGVIDSYSHFKWTGAGQFEKRLLSNSGISRMSYYIATLLRCKKRNSIKLPESFVVDKQKCASQLSLLRKLTP